MPVTAVTSPWLAASLKSVWRFGGDLGAHQPSLVPSAIWPVLSGCRVIMQTHAPSMRNACRFSGNQTTEQALPGPLTIKETLRVTKATSNPLGRSTRRVLTPFASSVIDGEWPAHSLTWET